VREVLGRIVRIAPTDAIVLITGESGTGKELVAKAIHANSKRADRMFVPVNCAAITTRSSRASLFGHAKGSFTGAVNARKGLFEEADGGTFFFDEIAETSLAFQAKLLRAIQENEIRASARTRRSRSTSASSRDEPGPPDRDRREALPTGSLLSPQRRALPAPALRERREDLPDLISYFLDKYNKKMGRRRASTKACSRRSSTTTSRQHPRARAHD
jgi:two-component system response regulator HydG